MAIQMEIPATSHSRQPLTIGLSITPPAPHKTAVAGALQQPMRMDYIIHGSIVMMTNKHLGRLLRSLERGKLCQPRSVSPWSTVVSTTRSAPMSNIPGVQPASTAMKHMLHGNIVDMVTAMETLALIL